MQWKSHFCRIAFLLLIASTMLAGVVKWHSPTSSLNELETRNAHGTAFILEKGNMFARAFSSDPCRQTPALEWATEEFGPQGCWVVQTYGEWGLRILLILKESEEFRKLFEDFGPNRLIPILGNALSHPEDFKLFITEDKALDVAGTPVRVIKKRWDAGKEVYKNGGTISDAAHAAMQSSGVAQATLQNIKKKYTPEETVILLLYLIEKGQGRFLDQFHLVRNDRGEVESVEIEYVKHGLHITTSFLTDGLMNFEKKYRWEKVSPGDVGWALLDIAFFAAPVYKVVKIGKMAKVTKAAIPTTAKATKIAKAAKVTKIIRIVAVVGGGMYAILHPWQALHAASGLGTWLLSGMFPEWMAQLFGPFLGIFLTLAIIYILAWPLIGACKVTRIVARLVLVPATFVARWLYPRQA